MSTGRDWRAVRWGKQEQIPGRGNSKAGSRSVKGRGENRSLMKCRVEVRGRAMGEAEGVY